MESLTDIEVLELKCGGMMLKEMSALTFFGWLAGRLNGVPVNSDPDLAELRMAIRNPPMMPKVADVTKIKYVRKLIKLGISL